MKISDMGRSAVSITNQRWSHGNSGREPLNYQLKCEIWPPMALTFTTVRNFSGSSVELWNTSFDQWIIPVSRWSIKEFLPFAASSRSEEFLSSEKEEIISWWQSSWFNSLGQCSYSIKIILQVWCEPWRF
jgi:hypothetical protein